MSDVDPLLRVLDFEQEVESLAVDIRRESPLVELPSERDAFLAELGRE